MILFLIIWSFCSLALFSLASSMSKHQKQIFSKTLSVNQIRLATVLGWTLLIISLIICISQGQVSNMMSYWIGVITFAALFVGICLSYFQSKIKQIAVLILITLIITSTFKLIA